MTKYCAINLNERYRLNFKYSRDKHTFLVKICLIYSVCICIDITLPKTVAVDLLQCEKIEKWCVSKLTGHKAFVIGSHC